MNCIIASSFYGAGNRTRTCTLSQWNLNPPSLPIPPCPRIIKLYVFRPVAVPGIFVAGYAASSSADRGHSLPSLHLPPAALGSLPTESTNSTMPACGNILSRLQLHVNAENLCFSGYDTVELVKLCLQIAHFSLTFRGRHIKI